MMGNDTTLRDYDIQDGDTVHVVLKLASSAGRGAALRPFHVTAARDGLGEWKTVHVKVKAM